MALSLVTSGTQTASIDTEHTLTTKTTSNIYILGVDCGAMALGDILELRIYTKMLSGGTSRVAYIAHYAHVQGAPNVYSIPVPSDVELKVTLKQTDGTGRQFPWALWSV